MSNKYTVIQDTREQDGWFFSPYDKCEGMGSAHYIQAIIRSRDLRILSVSREKPRRLRSQIILARKRKPFTMR